MNNAQSIHPSRGSSSTLTALANNNTAFMPVMIRVLLTRYFDHDQPPHTRTTRIAVGAPPSFESPASLRQHRQSCPIRCRALPTSLPKRCGLLLVFSTREQAFFVLVLHHLLFCVFTVANSSPVSCPSLTPVDRASPVWIEQSPSYGSSSFVLSFETTWSSWALA
jgi:hypothetical protein